MVYISINKYNGKSKDKNYAIEKGLQTQHYRLTSVLHKCACTNLCYTEFWWNHTLINNTRLLLSGNSVLEMNKLGDIYM